MNQPRFPRAAAIFAAIFFCTTTLISAQNAEIAALVFPSNGLPKWGQTSYKSWSTKLKTVNKAGDKADVKVAQIKVNAAYRTQQRLLYGNLTDGTAVQQHLNDIKNHLLKGDPKLRDNITVLVSLDEEAGAFMNINGTLVFSIGMYLRCATEAELAGIIAHEVVHFAEKHAENAIRNPVGVNDSDLVDLATMESRYSHQREIDADTKALEGFLKESGYRLSDMLNVFNGLAYSYLPMSEEPYAFNKLLFNCTSPRWDKAIASPRPVSPKDRIDDSKSSHPNAFRRQKAYQEKLQKIGYVPGTGEAFLVRSQAEFIALKKAYREASLLLLALDHKYLHVLYEEAALGRSGISVQALHALWAITTLKNDGNYDKVLGVFSDYEGELSTLYWFFKTLDEEDLNILAYRMAQQVVEANPNSHMAMRIKINLAGQLVRKFGGPGKNVNLSNPAFCGVADLEKLKSELLKDAAEAEKLTLFAAKPDVRSPRREPVPEARGSAVLMPISYIVSEPKDWKLSSGELKKISQYTEMFEAVAGSNSTAGTQVLSLDQTYRTASEAERRNILIQQTSLIEALSMWQWNSTISAVTDYFVELETTPKLLSFAALTYENGTYIGTLTNVNTDSQRIVDRLQVLTTNSAATIAFLRAGWAKNIMKSN